MKTMRRGKVGEEVERFQSRVGPASSQPSGRAC